MNINPIVAKKLYTAGLKEGATLSTVEKLPIASGKKQDTISISPEGASQKSMSKVASDIAREVDAPAASGRMELLKMAIRSGQYYIPTENIADAMLQSIR